MKQIIKEVIREITLMCIMIVLSVCYFASLFVMIENKHTKLFMVLYILICGITTAMAMAWSCMYVKIKNNEKYLIKR